MKSHRVLGVAGITSLAVGFGMYVGAVDRQHTNPLLHTLVVQEYRARTEYVHTLETWQYYDSTNTLNSPIGLKALRQQYIASAHAIIAEQQASLKALSDTSSVVHAWKARDASAETWVQASLLLATGGMFLLMGCLAKYPPPAQSSDQGSLEDAVAERHLRLVRGSQ